MKNTNRTMIAVTGVALLMTARCGWAQDWPQWRGANRDAKTTGFTAPNTWPKELTKKWKATVGQADATPALVGDKLYVFARQGGEEVTLCLDATTGKEVWSDKFAVQGATGASASHAGPRSSPTVAEGKVVTLGVRGTLTCFDAAQGKVLWRKDEFPGALPRFFTASSPIVTGGLCIAQLGGSDNGGIVAYDLNTGDQKWKWTGNGPAYASPALMTVDGTKLIIAETEKSIVALNAADGKLAWEAPFAAQGMSYNAATPIVDGQTLIYCGQGRGAKAVKIEKQGESFAAKELWSNPDNAVQFNTPVLKNGMLVGISQRGDFFCLNAQDGKTVWTAPSTPPAAAAEPPAEGGGGRGGRGGGRGRGGYGTVVDAGSVLLALSPSSELIAFQPSDKAYTELARIKVADSPTYAYPVVSGKRIFIEDQDSVTLWTVD
jgi:outer membrane protein assembly factor BamB